MNQTTTGRLMGCTLTGVDDSTDIGWLCALAAQFPLVEWGVLYSDSRAGEGRYPSKAWLDALDSRLRETRGLRAALHVCGSAVHDLLAGRLDLQRRVEPYERIQLNLNADETDLPALRQWVQAHPHKTVITQHNETNQHLWKMLADMPNHAVLFDRSRGTGRSPVHWPTTLRAQQDLVGGIWAPVCGYAGGLGPANLMVQLPLIDAAAGSEKFWVDMESALRDNNDRFHLGLAKMALTIVSDFAQGKAAGGLFASRARAAGAQGSGSSTRATT